MSIRRATTIFGKAYSSAKKAEARKAKRQKEFFAEIDKILEAKPRARKTIEIPTHPIIDTTTYIRRFYPGWRIVSGKLSDIRDGIYPVIIEEDPKLMKYTYVNPRDGQVYGRTTAQGEPQLDDERLRNEKPELWTAITQWPEPWYSMIYNIISDTRHIDRVFEEYNIERELKDPSMFTDEQLAQLQMYLVPAPLTVRLVPPREAKEEELEEA